MQQKIQAWDALQEEWYRAFENFDVDTCWAIFSSAFFKFWNHRTDFERVPGLGSKPTGKIIKNGLSSEDVREALLELGQPLLEKLQNWKHRMTEPDDRSLRSNWVSLQMGKGPDSAGPAVYQDQCRIDQCRIKMLLGAALLMSTRMTPARCGILGKPTMKFLRRCGMHQIRQKRNRVFSLGLGGWTYAHFKKLPQNELSPQLNAKRVVIPKWDSGFDLNALRPTSIEVTVLRIFHKWLFKCGEILFKNLPANVIGGIPGRSGRQAWLHASLS